MPLFLLKVHNIPRPVYNSELKRKTMAAELTINGGYQVSFQDADTGQHIDGYKEKQIIKQLQSGDLIASMNSRTLSSIDGEGNMTIEYTFELDPINNCELNWDEL